MAREVTDDEGIAWTCVEAYAGLGGSGGEAARVEGSAGRYRVVCTPSGAARSVELELPGGWEGELDDRALVRAIAAARAEG